MRRGNVVPASSEFRASIASIVKQVHGVRGLLTPKEVEFLAILGACPTAPGCIVELGTLFGKSAVALAAGSRLSDNAIVHSVDLKVRPDAETNLKASGVWDQVRLHVVWSHEFWKRFQEPIRLLWHDGANRSDIVAADVASALPLLADRAIVAMHDVLNSSGERLHAFVDHVLAAPQFGQAGVVGSIGWAQFRMDGCSLNEAAEKQRLARRLERLKPFHQLPKMQPRGLKRIAYEAYRQMVPHGAVKLDQWLARVA
jgi:predicted O-methyltransferase YrrM